MLVTTLRSSSKCSQALSMQGPSGSGNIALTTLIIDCLACWKTRSDAVMFGGFEMDVKLIIDDLKGFRLFGSAVFFNEGPGRLDCCDNGCG